MWSVRRSTEGSSDISDLARIRAGSAGLTWSAVNDQGYYVGRVEQNLYWVTDGDYHSAFVTTRGGVVLFDAPRLPKSPKFIAPELDHRRSQM